MNLNGIPSLCSDEHNRCVLSMQSCSCCMDTLGMGQDAMNLHMGAHTKDVCSWCMQAFTCS